MRIIDMQAIATVFNELLGSEFDVRVDSKTDVDDSKIPCTLQADVMPFPVDGVKCETLDITLTTYLTVDTEEQKNAQIYAFTKIVGNHKGRISLENVGVVEYVTFNMFLKSCRPVTDPAFDMGHECASYQIIGTMLLSTEKGGGVFTNDITTELCTDSTFGDTAIKGELTVLSFEVDPNYNVENTHVVNKNSFVPNFIAQSRIWALTGLLCDTPIDNYIRKAIEEGDTNIILYMRRKYPNESNFSQKKVMLVGGKTNGQAGAYTFYNALLQELA